MNELNRDHPAHIALTILAGAAFIALKYYGVDMGLVNDAISMVAGASAWGHCSSASRRSAFSARQQQAQMEQADAIGPQSNGP